MDLASEFSLRHGLNERLRNLLAVQIQNNIDQVMQERANNTEVTNNFN
jgi:hypothetical protein